MRSDAQRYLEHLCDMATARAAILADLALPAGAGVEPFGFGTTLSFSPARTKAVMRELLQYHLLDIAAVRAEDGRYELRLTPNGETARWYARVLRARRRSPAEAVWLGRG